jgi:hypothetical protein
MRHTGILSGMAGTVSGVIAGAAALAMRADLEPMHDTFAKPPGSRVRFLRYYPHNGKRECARRVRQLARGMHKAA